MKLMKRMKRRMKNEKLNDKKMVEIRFYVFPSEKKFFIEINFK